MSDLSELYQQVILDHNRSPRNFRKLEKPNRSAEGYNPLCGDQIKLYLAVEEDTIKEIGFEGSGCAISKASSSLMTSSVQGKSVEEATGLANQFTQMVTSDPTMPPPPGIGKLTVFSGVREFPMRVKCATLAWHTLIAALEGREEIVTTENEEEEKWPISNR